MNEVFTRYQLRRRLEDLDISVRYGQFKTYIEKGLLPDPDVAPWVESEIMPRMLRIHELDFTVRSLDRRVVVLYLERFPVNTGRLQAAMAGMLPTIDRPIRKMDRVLAAGRWFGARGGNASPSLQPEALPADWRMPSKATWASLLRAADAAVFENRINVMPYYLQLLAHFGKGTPHDLSDMDDAERLTLLMVGAMAEWHWHQQRGQGTVE